MARNTEETFSTYSSVRVQAEGSLGADPKNISKGDTAMVVFPIYCKNRDRNGEIGTLWYQVTVFGQAGENVLRDYAKNDRVIVVGQASERTYTNKDGEEVSQTQIIADLIGASSRYAEITIDNHWDDSGSGSRRSTGRATTDDDSDDDDEEEEEAAPRRSRGARSPNRRPRGGSSSESGDKDESSSDDTEEEAPQRSSRRERRNVRSHGDTDDFED